MADVPSLRFEELQMNTDSSAISPTIRSMSAARAVGTRLSGRDLRAQLLRALAGPSTTASFSPRPDPRRRPRGNASKFGKER
jgi:hypothetical protein